VPCSTGCSTAACALHAAPAAVAVCRPGSWSPANRVTHLTKIRPTSPKNLIEKIPDVAASFREHMSAAVDGDIRTLSVAAVSRSKKPERFLVPLISIWVMVPVLWSCSCWLSGASTERNGNAACRAELLSPLGCTPTKTGPACYGVRLCAPALHLAESRVPVQADAARGNEGW